MKKLFFISLVCVFSGCHGQPSDKEAFHKEDIALTSMYNEYYKDRKEFGHQKDSLLPVFVKQLEKTISDTRFLSFSFDSLTRSKQVSVVVSKDTKLKLVSWDTFNMGTWHIYGSMYRYIEDTKIYTGLLTKKDTSGEIIDFTDSFHFEIYDIDTNTYLIKSYGTHGSGRDFYTMRLLSFVKDEIKECNKCFDQKDYLLFEKNRADKVSPEYDQKNKTIQYPEYKEDAETGFLRKTGKTIKLYYNDGFFIKKE